jgi:hypothetical protein
MDVMGMPSEPNRNTCFFDDRYVCTYQNGEDITTIPTTGTYAVEGNLAIRNGRFVLSLDTTVADNWMLGLRIGWVAQRYRGSRAPHQDFTMGPAHVEVRSLYAFGEHPFVEGVAPYVLFAAGAAQFDAREGSAELLVWRVNGPLFASFGFGFRWVVSSDVAILTTPAKITLAFPYNTTLAWSPEIGTQVAF